MIEDVLLNTEHRMQASVEALKRELASIRTGRATPALIEHIKVDYAGTATPLRQIAGISVSGADLLVIQPWDPTSTQNIEKAILKSNLGLTPNSDGHIIRLSIPPLSEERRHELTRVVRRRIEDGKIAIRNLRHEAANELKKLERDKEISQDEHKRAMDKIQKLTDTFTYSADQAGRDKETELMEV